MVVLFVLMLIQIFIRLVLGSEWRVIFVWLDFLKLLIFLLLQKFSFFFDNWLWNLITEVKFLNWCWFFLFALVWEAIDILEDFVWVSCVFSEIRKSLVAEDLFLDFIGRVIKGIFRVVLDLTLHVTVHIFLLWMVVHWDWKVFLEAFILHVLNLENPYIIVAIFKHLGVVFEGLFWLVAQEEVKDLWEEDLL